MATEAAVFLTGLYAAMNGQTRFNEDVAYEPFTIFDVEKTAIRHCREGFLMIE